MRKRREMKVSTGIQNIEYTELCKTIRKRMKTEIRNYNSKKVQETIEDNRSYKATKRKLTNGKSQMIAIKDEDGNIIYDRDQVINKVKDFYQNLYSSKVQVDPPTINTDTEDSIPPIGADEVAKALKDMKREKLRGR